MKKETVCMKCKAETTTKRVKMNLMIDEETNNFIPVSARLQICPSCGHKDYNEKEKTRLRELINFYKTEAQIKEQEEQQEQEEQAIL